MANTYTIIKNGIELASVVTIAIGVISFMRESEDREDNRIREAWNLLNTRPSVQRDAPDLPEKKFRNWGARDALEFLSSRTTLHSISIIGADLSSIKMPNATLSWSMMRGVNFHGANLRNVNFTGANLYGAYLGYADLSGAIFESADITNADFRQAKGLKANQFKKACVREGESNPILLPPGIFPPEPSESCLDWGLYDRMLF